jgi:CspA family cold shock protein
MGTAKRYNVTKGFGFVAPDRGGDELFLHRSVLEQAGMTNIAEGTRVCFQTVAGKKAWWRSCDTRLVSTHKLRPLRRARLNGDSGSPAPHRAGQTGRAELGPRYSVVELAIAIVLIALNWLFSLSELAIVSARRPRLKAMSRAPITSLIDRLSRRSFRSGGHRKGRDMGRSARDYSGHSGGSVGSRLVCLPRSR